MSKDGLVHDGADKAVAYVTRKIGDWHECVWVGPAATTHLESTTVGGVQHEQGLVAR